MSTWQSHGFKCFTRISMGGVPCGYVGLDQEHPDFQKHYDNIDVEVHGGLTFSGYWEDQNDGLWYVGFDCGHAQDMDYRPDLGYNLLHRRSNKSLSYVQEETERLAEQMAKRKENKIK